MYNLKSFYRSYSNFGGENVDNGESIREMEEEEDVFENEQTDRCLQLL